MDNHSIIFDLDAGEFVHVPWYTEIDTPVCRGLPIPGEPGRYPFCFVSNEVDLRLIPAFVTKLKAIHKAVKAEAPGMTTLQAYLVMLSLPVKYTSAQALLDCAIKASVPPPVEAVALMYQEGEASRALQAILDMGPPHEPSAAPEALPDEDTGPSAQDYRDFRKAVMSLGRKLRERNTRLQPIVEAAMALASEAGKLLRQHVKEDGTDTVNPELPLHTFADIAVFVEAVKHDPMKKSAMRERMLVLGGRDWANFHKKALPTILAPALMGQVFVPSVMVDEAKRGNRETLPQDFVDIYFELAHDIFAVNKEKSAFAHRFSAGFFHALDCRYRERNRVEKMVKELTGEESHDSSDIDEAMSFLDMTLSLGSASTSDGSGSGVPTKPPVGRNGAGAAVVSAVKDGGEAAGHSGPSSAGPDSPTTLDEAMK